MKRAGFLLIVACLLFLCPAFSWTAGTNVLPSIRFLGAARTIGGSACLIDTGNLHLLIDFGAIPDEKNRDAQIDLPFDPALLDYILVTHAHMDHAGRIPLLFKKGFKGKVIGTDATRSLLKITLEQSRRILEERGLAGYSREDIEAMLNNYLAVPYDQKISPSPHLSLRLQNAGHILGSAMFELWLTDKKGPIKIIFMGDMGSGLIPLLPPPAAVVEGDYIIVESTYGPSRRDDKNYRDFGHALRKTILSGGSVLIPAFTLDRTQKVLYILGRLKKEGLIPADVPVYADSPSAAAITSVYRFYLKSDAPEANKQNIHDNPLFIPDLHQVSGRESLAAHERGYPAIYVTSSGMLDHGQAPRHLERMVGDERNLLAIVGWQAPGTLGEKLQKGAGTVRIPTGKSEQGMPDEFIERYVRMQVKSFSVFSGHADGCQILAWLSRFSKTKKVFVVHGEKDNTLGLARVIRENLGFAAEAPGPGDVLPLVSSDPDYSLKPKALPCKGLKDSKIVSLPMD